MLAVIDKLDITDAGVFASSEENEFVTGRTFVITGSVHRFKNRSEFKKYVEGQGGKVSGSVSKNTAYLVTNTPDSGTGKNKKARDLGIPVITEDEFCEKSGYQG
jgi:DNA ligase (NAD+)